VLSLREIQHFQAAAEQKQLSRGPEIQVEPLENGLYKVSLPGYNTYCVTGTLHAAIGTLVLQNPRFFAVKWA
jgi:hypothetical protein